MQDAGARVQSEQMREARQQLRLSQIELKELLNRRLGRSYDKSKISRWENGHEPIPRDVGAEMARLSRVRPVEARILVFANQKGGVGKTTSALNVAAVLSQTRRVLLLDMDPQATATVALFADGGVEAYRQGRTSAHTILSGRPLAETTIRRGEALAGRAAPFDVMPSHIELAETDGRREPGFDVALREAMAPIRTEYDWIVVDAPPNLGMLTWMALAAGDEVIIPVRTEPYDAMGVGLILSTINKVQRRLNPALRVAGVLPTQFGPRKLVDREVLAHLHAAIGARVPLLEPIPQSAVFGHAARDGRIAALEGGTTPAVAAYARLARALDGGASLPRATVNLPQPALAGEG